MKITPPPSQPSAYRTFTFHVDWSFLTGFCWGFGIATATALLITALVVLS